LCVLEVGHTQREELDPDDKARERLVAQRKDEVGDAEADVDLEDEEELQAREEGGQERRPPVFRV
jgi:hypothetical protein